MGGPGPIVASRHWRMSGGSPGADSGSDFPGADLREPIGHVAASPTMVLSRLWYSCRVRQ